MDLAVSIAWNTKQLAPALKWQVQFFFWNSVVPSDFLDGDVEAEDLSECKQKSNSKVVRK